MEPETTATSNEHKESNHNHTENKPKENETKIEEQSNLTTEEKPTPTPTTTTTTTTTTSTTSTTTTPNNTGSTNENIDKEFESFMLNVVDTSDLTTLTFNNIFEKALKQFPSQQSALETQKPPLRKIVKDYIAVKVSENKEKELEKSSSPTMKKQPKKKAEPKKKSPKKESPKKETVEKTEDKDEKDEEDEKESNGGTSSEAQKLMLEAFRMGATIGNSRTRSGGNRKKSKPLSKKKRKRSERDEEEGEENDKKKADEGKKEEGVEGEPKKKKERKNGFTKPQVLSPALSEFLGTDTLSRPEVVKRLHSYFKEKSLQNPKDKRKILFDDKLQAVFKVKTTDYFKLNKLISKHVN